MIFSKFWSPLIDDNSLMEQSQKRTDFSRNIMIIGAVAISRTIDDKQVVLHLLASCRTEVGKLLGDI
jgi:hypothetical protein